MNFGTLSKRILLPLTYVMAWAILYCLPRRMFHIGGDAGLEGWILLIVFFLGLPYLLHLILTKNGLRKDIRKVFVYGSVFLAIPFILLITSEDKKELATHGKEVIGIVDKAWLRQKRGGPIWSVQANYTIDGKLYRTSTKDDTDVTLSYGDTVTIIYSSRTPEICEIKELVERYRDE